MSEALVAPVSGSYAQTELRLLRRGSYTAGYVPQVIDFIMRGVMGSEFASPSEEGPSPAKVDTRSGGYAASVSLSDACWCWFS
ncbi:hypothetical protein ACFV3R_09920 [Streptomyces sp. NPDC059740]|uniref:hypothetical protein n=1 Tax=Streptomyces sp. NPDC059740 TaxID=3346926 RepID=UPI00365C4030